MGQVSCCGGVKNVDEFKLQLMAATYLAVCYIFKRAPDSTTKNSKYSADSCCFQHNMEHRFIIFLLMAFLA